MTLEKEGEDDGTSSAIFVFVDICRYLYLEVHERNMMLPNILPYVDKSSRGFNFAKAQNFQFRVDLISRLKVVRNISRGFNFAVHRILRKIFFVYSFYFILLVQ